MEQTKQRGMFTKWGLSLSKTENKGQVITQTARNLRSCLQSTNPQHPNQEQNTCFKQKKNKFDEEEISGKDDDPSIYLPTMLFRTFILHFFNCFLLLPSSSSSHYASSCFHYSSSSSIIAFAFLL